jgi:1-deoxy-D-xylulose-5-phosphate synthase
LVRPVAKARKKAKDGSRMKEAPSPRASSPLLESIRGPEDLKRLPRGRLPELCAEVREFLLSSVQNTGGHLGSNLGVVELATAIHYVFDLKRDRVVWDVSHQCYPHKIFTGRREAFDKLRQSGGICGFTNPAESDYDLFHTGHAGTSISLAAGMAMGTAHEANPPHAISVIGDASLGAGVAFEALNYAGPSGLKMLVVLNDNEWSISKSVGALAKYLSRIRGTRLVQRANQEMHNLLASIPLIGQKVDRTLEDLLEVARHAMIPGHVFEELGVTYVGPIDGHDVDLVVENLERVRRLDGAVILHTLTEKGRGHPKAPTHPERVHAAPSRTAKAESGKVPNPVAAEKKKAKGQAFTKAFGDSLVRLAERDLRIHALTAGMPSGTGLTEFAERFPTRFHDTGITEQHAVAMAAGMAKAGLRPVATIYSTFLQRGYDQVFQEVVLQGLPVLFCMDRAGLVGQDGPTHNGVFDIAFLRTFPGIVLCAPRDASDVERMLEMAFHLPGPVAMRYPRDGCPDPERIHRSERREMKPGLAEVLLDPDDAEVCVWALGPLVGEALEAAERLERRGVAVAVVDARFAKPLDEELLGRQLGSKRFILTLEEHQRAGGFGAAVLEAASRAPKARAQVRVLGIPDRFVDHMTTRDEQLAESGIDADAVERAIRNLLQPTLV